MAKSNFPRKQAFPFMFYNERGFIQVLFSTSNLKEWITFCVQGASLARSNLTIDRGARKVLADAFDHHLQEALDRKNRLMSRQRPHERDADEWFMDGGDV